jgi:DNA-directed RNA polymerase specialized sigma24 family protein
VSLRAGHTRATHAESPNPLESREALAAYLISNRRRVLAIVRRRISRSYRGVIDEEDILSSVLRRIDLMAMNEVLQWRSEAEFWSLVSAISRDLAVDRVRRVARPVPWSVRAHERSPDHNNEDTSAAVNHMLASVDDDHDRSVLIARLRGLTWQAASATFGIPVTALRKRWSRLQARLRDRFADVHDRPPRS